MRLFHKRPEIIFYLLLFAIGVLIGGYLKGYTEKGLEGAAKKDGKNDIPKLPLSLINGIAYVLVIDSTGWTMKGAVFCAFMSALLAAGIVDGKTFVIPARCNLLIFALGCVHLMLERGRWEEYAAGMLAAGGLFFLFFCLTEGKGIGGGDVKLMAASGLLLGWEAVLTALFTGLTAGLAVHAVFGGFRKRKRVMALGPCFFIGTLIVIFYGI